jgi:hypothetical protein
MSDPDVHHHHLVPFSCYEKSLKWVDMSGNGKMLVKEVKCDQFQSSKKLLWFVDSETRTKHNNTGDYQAGGLLEGGKSHTLLLFAMGYIIWSPE